MPYPASLFDDTEAVLSLLGTWWQQLYQGRSVSYGICRAKAESEKQAWQDAQEAAASFSREKCPVFHTSLWHPLKLRADKVLAGRPLLYGEPGVEYGDQQGGGSAFVYGGSVDDSVAWDLAEAGAEGLRECLVIASGIAAANVVLAVGVDFSIDQDRKTVVFRKDPFLDPLLPQDTEDDGTLSVTLWAFRGRFDKHLVQDQYGYAVGLDALESSEAFRELTDAVLDGLAAGPSMAVLQRAFAAIAGAPVATEGETVAEVATDSAGLLVLTDRNAHRLSAGSNVLVSAGDVLRAGQPLCDTVLLDLPQGSVPAGLDSLQVPASFFSGVTAGPLTFDGSDVALTVTEDVDGKTKLSWSMPDDDPADVAAFFARLHANGVASGTTLADCLDVRPQPTATEPTADNLPDNVNPLELLFENVFRSNLLLARVKSDLFGDGALGLDYLWALRRILPPTLALLVVDQS